MKHLRSLIKISDKIFWMNLFGHSPEQKSYTNGKNQNYRRGLPHDVRLSRLT